MDRELFKLRLQEVITGSGRSMKKIAECCGFTGAAFAHWLNADFLPSAKLLADFCAEMNISMDWLCGLSDRKELQR